MVRRVNVVRNVKDYSLDELLSILQDEQFTTPPLRHQAATLIWAASSGPRLYLWHDIGTGKTLTALYLLRMWEYDKALVVCPNSVLEQWEEQVTEHGLDIQCTTLTGKLEDRKRKLLEGGDGLYVTNYTSLGHLFGKRVKRGNRSRWEKDTDAVVRAGVDTIIFDEAHYLSNDSSQRSKVAYELSKRAERVLAMTGTPINTSEADLWGQYLVLDGGKTLGSRKRSFIDRYFNTDFWGTPSIKEGRWEELLDRVAPVTLRYDREECTDLPERTYEVWRVDQTAEQMQMANRILEGSPIDGMSEQDAMHIANKLTQIAGGFYIGDDGKGRRLVGANPKLNALVELLKMLGDRRVIVFHSYTEEAHIIEERLEAEGMTFASQRGETKEATEWKRDPTRRVLVAHPASGGVGLNLQAASTAIFFSRADCGAAVRAQAEGRIWRQGQREPCLFVDLLARGSVEEARLDRMHDRAEMARRVMDWLKNYR